MIEFWRAGHERADLGELFPGGPVTFARDHIRLRLPGTKSQEIAAGGVGHEIDSSKTLLCLGSVGHRMVGYVDSLLYFSDWVGPVPALTYLRLPAETLASGAL